MKPKDITDAYVRIRTIDHTIPDDVLDFMKNAALDKLTGKIRPESCYTCVYFKKKFDKACYACIDYSNYEPK